MNKYIKILLMMFLVCFMYIGNVKAEEVNYKVGFICSYYSIVSDTGVESVNCHFYEDESVECLKNEKYTSGDYSSHVSKNNGVIEHEIKSSNLSWKFGDEKCPKKLTYVTSSINNSSNKTGRPDSEKVYLYDVDSDLESIIDKANSYGVEYKEINKMPGVYSSSTSSTTLEEYNYFLTDYAYNYNIDSHCNKGDDGVWLPNSLPECNNYLTYFYEKLNKWNDNVDEAIDNGLLSSDNQNVKIFRELSNKVLKELPEDLYGEENPTIETDYNKRYEEKKEEEYEPRDVKCPLGPNVTKDLYGLLNILKIAAPILVIVLSVVDAIKALVKDDSKAELKKVAIRFGKRAVFAVILFFLPVLVNQVMIMANIWDENGTCDLSNPQENEATSSNDKDTNTDNKSCDSLSIQDCSSNKQCTQYDAKCVYKCKYLSPSDCANNKNRCTVVNDKKCANK